MWRIEWKRDRRRIVVPVALLRPFDGKDMDHITGAALLDTGATASGITPRVVNALGLTGKGKRPLSSAHGEQQTERYLFRIGLFPETANPDIPQLPYIFDDVLGFELQDSFKFEALIGMNILSQCDFTMDRQGYCTLTFGFI